MADMLNVRVLPKEKHAIRILAAKDNLNMSDYILKVLRENTPLDTVANSLASNHPQMEKISTSERTAKRQK